MKKWIRFQGVAIFLVIAVLLSVFWIVFADSLIKRGIEEAGSRIVGAKVDLKKADLSLFPIGLELVGLQVTNPDEPMRNMFEVERINFSLETGYLFQRKFVGDEMVLDGVRLDTPRKVSGFIERKKSKSPEKKSEKEKKSFITIPRLSMEDAQSVLKKESLKTLEEVERFQKDIKTEQENLQKLLTTLPNQKKFEGYKERINSLKSGGGSLGSLFGAAKEVDAVKNDIEKDMNSLKNAKSDLQGKMSEYKVRLEKLKNMPMEDLNRLKNKYSISSKGLGNMAFLLFGSKYGDWVTKGISLYEKAKPYMEKSESAAKEPEELEPKRGEGVDIKFEEDNPVPDFLIRLARVSLDLEAGRVGGEVMNIASDQVVHGKPVTFQFSGEKMQNMGKIRVEGSVDRTIPAQAVDTVTGQFEDYRFASMDISSDSALPITLKKALADVQVGIKIQNERIESSLNSGLKSVVIETGDSDDQDPVRLAIKDALSEISKFQIAAELDGTLEDYDIKIKSDIDRVMKDAIGNVVKKQVKLFEKKLKQAITEKTGNLLGGLDSNMAGFGSIEKEIGNRLNLGDGLLGNLDLF